MEPKDSRHLGCVPLIFTLGLRMVPNTSQSRGLLRMKLPRSLEAIVPERKLTGYLLSETHPVGRAKAKFFRALGFIGWLIQIQLQVRAEEVSLSGLSKMMVQVRQRHKEQL